MTTTKELLLDYKKELMELKTEHEQTLKEIDKEITDCEMALKAIEPEKEMPDDYIPNTEKKVERVPKVGDVLVCVADHLHTIKKGEEVLVDNIDVDYINVKDKEGRQLAFFPTSIQRNFRFKDELATEDLSNLHSFQHASPEPKKPYRIKTREEMIDGGAMISTDGFIYPTAEAIPWNPEMNHLHGLELDTNKEQTINSEPNHALGEWIIDTWMVTENN